MRIAGLKNPKVGMGCTIHYYSDAEPATVVRVSESGKTCWIRMNDTKAIGEGFWHQDWEILDDLIGEEIRVNLRKNGWYFSSEYVELGRRYKYYDWEF